MRFDVMAELIEAEFGRIREIRETKGREYAGEEDTLADFKEVAAECGITPLQCWDTYVKKHVRAIDTFIREGEVKSEAIEGRIRDVIVYHLLLLGLIQDLDPEREPESEPENVLGGVGVMDYRCVATWGSYRCALPLGHEGQHLGGHLTEPDIYPDTRWDHINRRVRV